MGVYHCCGLLVPLVFFALLMSYLQEGITTEEVLDWRLDLLTTLRTTTSNYSAVANLHTLQIH
jgi:hypothetical protein